LQLLIVVFAALQLACGGPTRPTQLFPSPKVICPAPVAQPSPLALPLTITYGAATSTAGTPPTTVSCTPASGSTFPLGTTPVTCTATDEVRRTNACTFTVQVIGPPMLPVTSFLAFGDSITFGENGANFVLTGLTLIRPQVQLPTPDTYPGALQADLIARYTAQSPRVFNAGLRGEKVTDSGTFSRFRSFTSTGLYNTVLLMEGANDVGNASVPFIIGGLGRMVDEATGRGMRVFLATLPPQDPLGCCPRRGNEARIVPAFNDQVRQLAAQKGVPLVDVFQAFNGDLSLLSPDGLHPNATGYHLIAEIFFASIRQNLELPPSSAAAAALRVSAAQRRR
jgi:lysophospholipase L1-like esterase